LSPGIIIQNLTISNNPSGDGAGAAIYDESTNSIFKNLHIYNNTYGIYSTSGFIEAKSAILYESANSIYKNLHIYNNTYGIYLTSDITSRVITNNFIQNNNIGIYYWYSGSNLIYNNYFDNIRNSEIHSDDEIINYWNITKTPGMNIIGGPNLGGNYWSDYTEMDLDGDGFGEKSYLVDNLDIFIDHLPLTDNVNLPPTVGNPKPSDSSSQNPLELDWSIQINDSKGGVFDWNISCSNGQYNYSFESSNGTKTIHLNSLSYSTKYTVWVKVFDYYRWTNETFTFTTKGKNVITNIPPIAIIDGIFIGFPGENLNFDASQSYDSDGYITTYNWILGDGTLLNGQNINHSFSKHGIYIVSLTVFDNNGASNTTTSNVIIIKANNPPELNLTLYNSKGNLSVNLTITVIDKDGDNISCIINWDDNTSLTLFELYNNQTITKNHRYSSYEDYEIQVTANDGSTITTESRSLTLTEGNNKEDKNNTNGKGNTTSNVFLDIIENNEPFDEPFLDNKIDSRSILGDNPDKNYAKIIATILSIILLFLLNYLIEFFSDYFSEKTIDYRKNWKSRFALKTAVVSAPGMFLSIKELVAIIASTLILSFVLTWTWVPDLSMFLETFVVFLLIIIVIIFIREALRGFLCSKFKFHSEFYVWPLGAIMMFVSTAIGNTFSLAANHHYDEEDIKKCGKVSFIVSFVIFVILAVAFLYNLYYPSTIIQMIIIVSVLNLFIDLFPLNPMDGYEVRHWNFYLWLCFYIIIIISYVVIYFNLYP
jgi:parallel beta-helix repeat protein